MNRLKYFRNYVIAYDIILKTTQTNSHQLPALENMSISVNFSSFWRNKIKKELIIFLLQVCFNQAVELVYTTKVNSKLNIPKNVLIGCKLNLSKNKSYDFLTKLLLFYYPTLRNFSGIPFNKNTNNTLVCTITDMSCFPELINEQFRFRKDFTPFNLIIHFNTKNYMNAKLLLTGLNIPLKK
jgi:ribosomal protein L5